MEESSDARELPKSDKPAFPRPKPGVDGKFTSVLLSAFFTSSALDSAMDTILPLIRDRNYTQVARQCRELEATVLHHSPLLTSPDPHHQPYSRILLRFHHVASFPKRIVPPKAHSS